MDLDIDRLFLALLRSGASAERFAGGGPSGKNTHLLLQLNEQNVGGRVSAGGLESLKVVGKLVARKFLIDLGVRSYFALVGFDLFFHSRKGFERRLLGNVRHRFVDALLSVGSALLGEQQILLAVRLFDVVVEGAQRIL